MLWRRRGTVLATAILGLIAGGVYLLLAPKTYTVTSKVLVKQALARSPEADPSSTQTKSNELFHATQAQVMKSTPVLALAANFPGADDLKTFVKVRNRSQFLKENLDVQPGRADEVITLSLATRYPDEGVKLLKSVNEAYEAFQKRQRKTSFQDVENVLKEEKTRIDESLAVAEQKLADYKVKNPNAAKMASGGADDRRLNSLSSALTNAELDAIKLKTEFTSASSTLSPEDLAKLDAHIPVGGLTDGEIESIRSDYLGQQKKLTQLNRTYLPSHPAVKAAAERAGELQLQYVAAMKQKWTIAQQREAEIRKTLTAESASANAEQQQANEVRTTLAELERDRERLRATAAELDRKIKDVSVTVDAGLITVDVLDEPVADLKDHKPQAAVVLPIAGLIGLAVGSVFGLLRESTDPRLVSPAGVRASLGTPVLGAVPPSGNKTLEAFGWSVHAEAGSAAAESLRAVRTSLQYALQESGARRIVITSPDQMDGKSTVASNLAIALAKSGRNVLLVDANLRDPVQHRIFGVSDAVGLADILSSGELNERAIRRTTIEHLHVMPAGEASATASELLNSSALGELMEQLQRKYDLVLVDSPAAGVVDDARIIAATCDGAVLVVRSGVTNRRVASAARDGLLSVGCRILGVVVNRSRDLTGIGSHFRPMESGNMGNRGDLEIERTSDRIIS